MRGVIRPFNKVSKFTLSIFSLALLCSVLTPANAEERFIDIGTSEIELLKNYGPPTKVVLHPEDTEFGMNETKFMEFERAKIDLHRGKKGYYIWRLEINGLPWTYRDQHISVGTKEKTLIEVLGKPESIETEGKIRHFFYRLYSFDAWTRVTIVNGLVKEIFASEDWA